MSKRKKKKLFLNLQYLIIFQNFIWKIFKHTEELKASYGKQLYTHYLESTITRFFKINFTRFILLISIINPLSKPSSPYYFDALKLTTLNYKYNCLLHLFNF